MNIEGAKVVRRLRAVFHSTLSAHPMTFLYLFRGYDVTDRQVKLMAPLFWEWEIKYNSIAIFILKYIQNVTLY